MVTPSCWVSWTVSPLLVVATSWPPYTRTSLSPDCATEIAPVAAVSFRPEVQTTGTVAFDGDISTQVLSPISGPVLRILVEPGAWVTKGAVLATVSSPDFASAVSDFRKAQATAVQTRRVAGLDSALFKNDGIARRDMEQAQTDALSAEADRDAALQALEVEGDRAVGELLALRFGELRVRMQAEPGVIAGRHRTVGDSLGRVAALTTVAGALGEV